MILECTEQIFEVSLNQIENGCKIKMTFMFCSVWNICFFSVCDEQKILVLLLWLNSEDCHSLSLFTLLHIWL